MKNFFRYKYELIFAVVWLLLAIVDVIAKNYLSAMMGFLISSCSWELYDLKKDKYNMMSIQRGKRAIRLKSDLSEVELMQLVENIKSGKFNDVDDESEDK